MNDFIWIDESFFHLFYSHSYSLICLRGTLKELIFAGTNFRFFRCFSAKSRKFEPAKIFPSSKPRELIPAKNFRKCFQNLKVETNSTIRHFTSINFKERFHKHRHDAKSRPENSELAEHFSKDQHNFDKDIDVTILKHDLFTKEEREYHEDRMICMLGTKNPSGINQTTKAYGREVYAFAQKLLQWRQLKNTS